MHTHLLHNKHTCIYLAEELQIHPHDTSWHAQPHILRCTQAKYRCSHCPASCPWRWPRQRGQRSRETTRKRTKQTATLTGVSTICVCVCARKRVRELVAQVQHATPPLTQIRSSSLCLTLTADGVYTYNEYVHSCLCACVYYILYKSNTQP